ncbi:hypothetical protein GALMADRAFT_222057 [Galerina marginata CBS 339.88]|uniref:Uncharacterized protein n=1 Tax=Galerina marginata (strain CBS 339.88) TaxID=685588 RepID=A0A067TG45_GALM3|nr:hypothetical protein GALMADRAFT_222057 [Galerina marginata CBS 339.88]
MHSQQAHTSQAQYQQYGQQQQLHHRTSPSQEYAAMNIGAGQDLGRSKSMNMNAVPEYSPHSQSQPLSAASAGTGATQYFSPVAESYASHYQGGGGYQTQSQSQSQSQSHSHSQTVVHTQQTHTQSHQHSYSASGGDMDMDDAYGGYVADGNPFDGQGQGQGHVVSQGHGGSGSDHSRYSEHEEEEEEPRRVLKVANE